ncbi:MAG: UxaA family hydrolase [Parvularculaceae bacterium]
MNAEPTLAKRVFRLHEDDNVVLCVSPADAGARVADEDLLLRDDVPAGHKVSARAIAAGEPIRKYGQIIGFAVEAIPPGTHVHTHNVEVRDFDRAAGGNGAPATDYVETPATFMGFRRADGRAATRNYIGVLTSVNCSATVATHVADAFRGASLAPWPNVDGVVALTHNAGCCVGANESFVQLRRTIAGFARHPNFAGVLIIGLGCEANQIAGLMETQGLAHADNLRSLVIQDEGGTTATVRAGREMVGEMLDVANDVAREPIPASELVLGLECGGSDGYSGITANPALGAAADLLVRHGGTAILSETPEIYGAEHLLTSRADTPEVAEKLKELIRWWEGYASQNGGKMDNNPSHGNKAGGLTTIYEKSLGAVAKGGTTRLMDVYRYGEPIDKKGFVLMDSPGYDPMSITGQVASGANIVAFTTGRGSVYGCKPVPSVKLATNTAMFERMSDDMDVNCGRVLDGEATIAEMGEEIFRRLIAIASGERTRSEVHGFGDNEFVPWTYGAQM